MHKLYVLHHCFINSVIVPSIIITVFLILEMYSRFLILETGNIDIASLQINIIHHKTCIYFCLNRGFSKAYYHESQKQGYTKPISPIGLRRARQGSFSTFSKSTIGSPVIPADTSVRIRVIYRRWHGYCACVIDPRPLHPPPSLQLYIFMTASSQGKIKYFLQRPSQNSFIYYYTPLLTEQQQLLPYV